MFDAYGDDYLPLTKKTSTTLRARAALIAAAAAASSLGARGATAQVVPGSAQQIGSLAADRARIAQLLGEPVQLPAHARDTTRTIFRAVLPNALLVHNSDIPYTRNDGDLWAGRGFNLSLTGGVQASRDFSGYAVRAIFAPTLAVSQNKPFQFFRDTMVARSVFSSYYHSATDPLDLPSRFGDRLFYQLGLGQSELQAEFPSVVVGVSSTNEWWGPGIQNTLILSNTAAGIPRAFIRTPRPLRTKVGSFAGELFSGSLLESPFFDNASTNDLRRINGLLVTYKPAVDTGLTIGFSRTVYANESSALTTLAHPLDALWHWGTVTTPGDTMPSGQSNQSADQLMSLFFRWVFAPAGAEIYAELGREEFPRSLREFLVAPQSTQAYVIGFQDAYRLNHTATLRTQVEFTNLEQPLVYPDRPPLDWYAGRATTHGYTQRGQLLGAAIGPGSSAQFLAVDYIVPRWQLGVFAGRTRYDEDALIRQFFPNTARHDSEIYSGLRGGWRESNVDLWAELTVGRRLNYLFQDEAFHAGTPRQAIDIQNVTLTFRVDPRALP